MLMRRPQGDILVTIWHKMEVVFFVAREFGLVVRIWETEIPTSVNNLLLLSKLHVYQFIRQSRPQGPFGRLIAPSAS